MEFRTADPQLLCAIALTLASWSRVEGRLLDLFRAISETRNVGKADALFDGIISFEIRLGICNRLMALEKSSEVEQRMWAKLSERLTKGYKRRHELAHFGLLPSGNEIQVVPFPTTSNILSGRYKALTLSQVEKRRESFYGLHDAVKWFELTAMGRHKLFGIDRPPPPEPPLIVHIRGLASQNLEGAQFQPGPELR